MPWEETPLGNDNNSRVVSLINPEGTNEIVADIVRLLEDALARAKAGQIEGLVLGYMSPQQRVFTAAKTSGHIAALLGVATVLQRDIMEEWTEC